MRVTFHPYAGMIYLSNTATRTETLTKLKLGRTFTHNVFHPPSWTTKKQGNQRWQTSPAAPPGGLGHCHTGMCMSNFMMIGWEMAEILHIEISRKHVSVTYDLDLWPKILKICVSHGVRIRNMYAKFHNDRLRNGWDITLWNFAKTRTNTDKHTHKHTNTQTNRHGHYNTSPYGGRGNKLIYMLQINGLKCSPQSLQRQILYADSKRFLFDNITWKVIIWFKNNRNTEPAKDSKCVCVHLCACVCAYVCVCGSLGADRLSGSWNEKESLMCSK